MEKTVRFFARNAKPFFANVYIYIANRRKEKWRKRRSKLVTCTKSGILVVAGA